MQEFIDLLPEDKREAFKSELGKYVLTNDIGKHPEFQRQLSLKHETTMANWQKEKLPEIIEAEVRKRSTKSPEVLEIEALRNKIEQSERNSLLKERKVQAITEFSKLGLDPDLSDFVLIEDEDKFKATINNLTGKLSSWRDKELQKYKSEIFGNNPPPKRGENGSSDFSKMTMSEVMAYASQSPEAKQAVLDWQKTKR